MKRQTISLRQAGFLAGAFFLFIVVMNFNARLEELDRLSQRADQTRAEATQVALTQTGLDAQLTYAASDQAVQDWAYSEGHMVRDGDRPVVPVAVPGSPPINISQPTPAPTPMQNWEIWWELFFGE